VIGAVFGAGLIGLAAAFAVCALREEERRRLFVSLEATNGRERSRRALPTNAFVAVGALLAWVLGRRLGGFAFATAATGAVVALPAIVRRRRARRLDREISERLVEGVSVIAAGMRSGRSLLQAIELAADELDPPLGPSFRRVVNRTGLGDALDDAIHVWATDLDSADARLVAGVLLLHRRTGGALAATLDELAGTLRARRSAAREVHSLTAQARLSAAILGLLPVGFFLFLSVVARDDLRAAFETRVGVAAIGLGFALQAVAYVWIRRLLRVEA
jgi:tight adherence protein B